MSRLNPVSYEEGGWVFSGLRYTGEGIKNDPSLAIIDPVDEYEVVIVRSRIALVSANANDYVLSKVERVRRTQPPAESHYLQLAGIWQINVPMVNDMQVDYPLMQGDILHFGALTTHASARMLFEVAYRYRTREIEIAEELTVPVLATPWTWQDMVPGVT